MLSAAIGCAELVSITVNASVLIPLIGTIEMLAAGVRQCDRESGPLTGRADHRDVAAMNLDDPLGNRQTEARAACLIRRCSAAVEAVENVRHILWLDSGTRVAHLYNQMVLFAPKRQ